MTVLQPKASAVAEQRSEPRHPVQLQTTLRSARFLEAENYWMRNLSTRGAFLETSDYSLDVGERLYLELIGPEGVSLKLIATVAWTNLCMTKKTYAVTPGIGVRFLSLDEATESRLRAFIEA